jgi:hypothetical protein
MRNALNVFLLIGLVIAFVLVEVHAGSSAYRIAVLLGGAALICAVVIWGARRRQP